MPYELPSVPWMSPASGVELAASEMNGAVTTPAAILKTVPPPFAPPNAVTP